MLELIIPWHTNSLIIETLILDLNGTLAVGWKLVDGIWSKISTIQSQWIKVVLFSGDTRWVAQQIADDLGIEYVYAPSQEEKYQQTLLVNPLTCASIGNGLIDKKMMEAVTLSIVTLQAEWVHRETLLVSDIVVPSILDALDLFVDHDKLIATLRK